ncbi:hypothetical protein ACIA8C_42790 [Nocardia sp. NPDC051321]|uniref:hypothetical protein n=1 Tax=Nocardia sp. NPDC051321 TaxID=3364323 RepID=UPI0037B9309D
MEILPNWRVALCLQFPESELRALESQSIAADTIELPSVRAGFAVNVMVIVGTADASLDGLQLVAVLDQEAGRKVALVHLALPFDPAIVAALHAQDSARIPLIIAGVAPTEPFDWAVVPGTDGSRLVIEYAKPDRDPDALPALPPFRGTVLAWNTGPQHLRHLELACGILVYKPADNSRLYVDQRSRCDHRRLGRNAQELCDAADLGQFDNRWSNLPSSEPYTILSTQRVLDEAGVDPNNPQLPPEPSTDLNADRRQQ